MIKPDAEVTVCDQNKGDRRWWALAVLAVADFVILDASVVNIALLAFERGLQSWEVVPEVSEDSEADERNRTFEAVLGVSEDELHRRGLSNGIAA
jgi:hypothetical protein